MKFFTEEDIDLKPLYGIFSFECSQRGKPILLYNNFRFRKERSVNNIISWRCATKNCKGRLTMRSGVVEKYCIHDMCFIKPKSKQMKTQVKTQKNSYVLAEVKTEDNSYVLNN